MRHGDLKLIVMPGCEEFAEKVAKHLRVFNEEHDGSFFVNSQCVRFDSGEAKGVILESVRGKDIFIITDPFNYSVEFEMRGVKMPTPPDVHYQDVKRVIAAIAGKAARISVIMPMLYEGRQHKKKYRESLDCAVMLQELTNMGVENLVTFDAHDARVQSAIPLIGFDDMHPTYQMTKALCRKYPDIRIEKDSLVIISPDEGGITRCVDYTEMLDLDLGMFYKRRDLSNLSGGHNPIMEHRYLGKPLDGKDAIVIDDMVSSGSSLIKVFTHLRQEGAKRIFAFITFGLFCKGYQMFKDAYEQGIFDQMFVTNLTYVPQEIIDEPWFCHVDMCKYTAFVIDAINQDRSVGEIIDPKVKIDKLLARHREELAAKSE